MLHRIRPALAGTAALGLLLAACDGSSVAGPTPESALAPVDGISAQVAVVPPGAAVGIHALIESWNAAWNAGDGIAYGNHYSADADFVNPLGAVITGSTAIGTTHVFLFNPAIGPFRGTTSSSAVRRMVALTGSLVMVDLTTTLTGLPTTPPLPPPGLVEYTPGVVKTRMKLVVGRVDGEWRILAQQITAMQPFVPE
jgi:uncharacterized protein (TIGR02246 family)